MTHYTETMYSDILSNHDIIDMLNHKLFQGVFSHDKLPTKPKKGVYVLNLDESKNGGTHWVLLSTINKSFYFDSFGLPPSNRIINFLKKYSHDVYYNTSQYQPEKSERCGWYVIYVAKRLMDGAEPFDIIQHFSMKNLKKNDRLVRS